MGYHWSEISALSCQPSSRLSFREVTLEKLKSPLLFFSPPVSLESNTKILASFFLPFQKMQPSKTICKHQELSPVFSVK